MPDRGFESAGQVMNRLARECGLVRGTDETDLAFRQRVRMAAAEAPVDWNALKKKLEKITSPKTIAWLERWRKR